MYVDVYIEPFIQAAQCLEYYFCAYKAYLQFPPGLALTAESEYAMSRSLHGQGSKESNSELSRLIAPLISMRKQSTKYPEDDFQAQICLAWIYWAQADYVSAAEHSLSSTEQDFLLEGSGNGSANWTRICIIKGAYIRGSSLTKTGVPGQALEALEAALPVLASMPSSVQNENELKTWTELLLTQFCILSSHSIRTKRTTVLESDTLSAFRAWSKFWDRQSLGGFHAKAEVSRRYVWKEYYASISIILQEDLPYPTTSLAVAYNDTTTRRRQRAELQHVETCYENLLLKEVSFPRAEQASEEIEEWVNLVVQNWKVLCGSNWQEEELGEGGRETATRNVLDILYRAATKTFHSTSILRHLFTVHLAVADFDLAFKAFDTYIEIVKKSKARVEKTNEDEPGLDDDATVLKTVSEAIRALCRYGSHREVEKARDTAHYFKDWLTKRYPDRPQTANGSEQTFKLSEDKQSAYLPSHIKALIWGAIGIADAQWARVTYEASNRSEIQLEAIKCLGKSLSKEYGRTRDIDSLYALALVFAERRELNSALEVVKSALLPPLSSTSTDVARYGGKFSRERSLIPLWHLLALLLSARQEFNTAVRACEGAFEQFRDPANLFGTKDLGSAYRSEHLNESEADTRQRSRGVVDEMDDSEKETVLEVKMTQLVLVEIMEGPDVAISASEELLSLYSRLFGGQHSISSTKPPPQTSQTMVPRSSAGTLRSIKGSIFGRKSIRTPAAPPSGGQLQTLPERPQTSRTVASTVTRAPTIHVTSTNGNSSEKHHHEKLHKKGSLRKKDSTSRRDGSTSRAPASLAPESINSDSQLTAAQQPLDLNLTRLSQVGLAISPDFTMDHAKSVQPNDTPYQQASYVQSLPVPAQNLPQKEAALQPLGAPGHQDTRLPIGPRINHNPTTKFSKVEQHRQRVGSLVRVWLLIAGFYRRGEMLEDARGAIDEAANLVQGLEDDISNLPPGTASVDEAGWGQKKSVEEMWGDVLSEVC